MGNLLLVMYRFDFYERIEREFKCEEKVNDGDTWTESGSFSTNGTINEVPVVLSLDMVHRYYCTFGRTNDDWELGDITIKDSCEKPPPFTGEVFTTKSRGDNNFTIVPNYS